jgi:Zn-dependent peptidase ImmA (M78 family)/transcriptional regulator with XRE-family HTH domain
MTVRKEQPVYGERIKEAREIRGLSQTVLAELINVKRQAVSAFEKNKIKPSPESLFAIASVTGFPVPFFLNERPRGDSLRTAPISFRKKSIASKTAKLQAIQYENLFADIYFYIDHYLDFHPSKIPFDMDIDYRSLSSDGIEMIASNVRRKWGLGDGPIPDMIRLLENNGILIAEIELPKTLDAISTWRHNRPFILLGDSYTSCARRRFNLGHELGHLVLHQMVPEEDFENINVLNILENQAHRFAGAFLFPAVSVNNEYFSNSLTALKNLKSRWKISIAAIARRLFDLYLINKHQYKYIMMNIRSRKNEVLDDTMPMEKPTLIGRAFEILQKNHILSLRNAVDDLMISDDFFSMLTGIEMKKQNRVDETIIPFDLRRVKRNSQYLD